MTQSPEVFAPFRDHMDRRMILAWRYWLTLSQIIEIHRKVGCQNISIFFVITSQITTQPGALDEFIDFIAAVISVSVKRESIYSARACVKWGIERSCKNLSANWSGKGLGMEYNLA